MKYLKRYNESNSGSGNASFTPWDYWWVDFNGLVFLKTNMPFVKTLLDYYN